MAVGHKWEGDEYYSDKGVHHGGIWESKAGRWVASVYRVHECHKLESRDAAVAHMEREIRKLDAKRKERSDRQKAYRERKKSQVAAKAGE